ncbi:MAG: hypothetical protein ACLVLA_03165 [Acidaminococcus intestini]
MLPGFLAGRYAEPSCGRYIYDVELVRENGYTDTLIPPRPFFLERGVTDDGA